MKNRPHLRPVVFSLFISLMLGFWLLAYWSSPEEQSGRASRMVASDKKHKLVSRKKLTGMKSRENSMRPILKSPEKEHEWFNHARQEQYEGHTYLISQDFYALPQDLYLNDAEVVKQSHGWVYFKDPKSQTRGYELWRDVNSKAIFIATKRIFIHFAASARPDDLWSRYDFEIAYKAPGRKLYLAKIMSQRSPLQIIEELRMEDGIKRVELELIGSAPEPR